MYLLNEAPIFFKFLDRFLKKAGSNIDIKKSKNLFLYDKCMCNKNSCNTFILRSNRKIEDVRVKQIYENSNAFEMGKTTIEYDGVDITIYNEERLLIELIRNKRKFSFDLYKEIISNYRKLIHKMDMTQIMEYAYELPKTNMVMETIRLEIL